VIKCIAIDDEPLALELIHSFAAQNDAIDLVSTFTNVQEAETFLENEKIDMLFLDIEMPDMNGMEFCRKFAQDKMVIFTTAYSNFAYEGFNLNAVDYLLKPFDYARFDNACEKAVKLFNYKNDTIEKDTNFIIIKSEYKIINLALSKLCYIESKDDYVKLFLTDGKFIMSKMTTKSMEEKLPQKSFIRIHRSYIVNTHHIKSIAANKLTISNVELPIGKKYKKEVMNCMPL
jgi:DNA-binding LytR/AlgR family response regulator